jgi:hypothetical protein
MSNAMQAACYDPIYWLFLARQADEEMFLLLAQRFAT